MRVNRNIYLVVLSGSPKTRLNIQQGVCRGMSLPPHSPPPIPAHQILLERFTAPNILSQLFSICLTMNSLSQNAKHLCYRKCRCSRQGQRCLGDDPLSMSRPYVNSIFQLNWRDRESASGGGRWLRSSTWGYRFSLLYHVGGYLPPVRPQLHFWRVSSMLLGFLYLKTASPQKQAPFN